MKKITFLYILTLVLSFSIKAKDISFELLAALENEQKVYTTLNNQVYLDKANIKKLKKNLELLLDDKKILSKDDLIVLASALTLSDVNEDLIEDKYIRKTHRKLNDILDISSLVEKQLKNFPMNLSYKANQSLKFMVKYGSKGALLSVQALLLYYAMPAGQVLLATNISSLNSVIAPAILDKVIPGAIASLTTDLQKKLLGQLGIKMDDYLAAYFEPAQAIPGAKIAWSEFTYDPLNQLFTNLNKLKIYENLLLDERVISQLEIANFVKSQILSGYLAVELDLRAVIRQTSGLILNNSEEGIEIIVHLAHELKDSKSFNEILTQIDAGTDSNIHVNSQNISSEDEIKLFDETFQKAKVIFKDGQDDFNNVTKALYESIFGVQKTLLNNISDSCVTTWNKLLKK